MAQLDKHLTSDPVMVSVVGLSLTGTNLFADNFKKSIDAILGLACKFDLLVKSSNGRYGQWGVWLQFWMMGKAALISM